MKHGLYAMMIDSILYMINIDNQNYDNIVIWLLIIVTSEDEIENKNRFYE